MNLGARAASPSGPRARVAWAPLLISSLVLVGSLLVATGVGAVRVSPPEVIGAVARGLQGEASSSLDVIVWRIRLPRVLLAALVGGALSLAGVAFQGIFRNPLADPYLLGVASGASLGAALGIVLAGILPLAGRLGVPLLAYLFALLAVGLVLLLARRGSRIPVLPLILAGAVLSSSFSAGTSFLMILAHERVTGVLAWILGSFAQASWERVFTVAPFLLLLTITLVGAGRPLNLLQLGDAQAAQLGLRVDLVRYVLIGVATLATATAVSVSGVIGFVGLLVPHSARLLVGADHGRLVPLSLVMGATLMVLADLLARTVIAPVEVPIGIVTALAGGPFFLWLLRRQQRP